MKNLPFFLGFLCLLITFSLFGQEDESNIDNFINILNHKIEEITKIIKINSTKFLK